MRIERIETAGLGDATYLLTHDGLGVIIDPQRDIARFERAAAGADVEVRAVVETHVHNDYVSGARHLAAATGAELVLPAAAGAAYRHRAAFHQEDLDLGSGLALRPLHTPGHTPEHTSYLVVVDGEPLAVFTGGSLLTGSAGRTDLVAEAQARQLARLQYQSLERLAALPGHVGVYPTHGEGSFCTATGAGRDVSDIATELTENEALGHDDADAFAAWQAASLQPFPDYYARMGPANLLGRTPMPRTQLPLLEPADVDALDGVAEVVDIRPRAQATAGHVPGSQLIELGDDFGVWAGWVLDLDAPVVLVATPDDDVAEAALQLARIGIDDVRGVLPVAAWSQAGRQLRRLDSAAPHEVAAAGDGQVAAAAGGQAGPVILDVRSPGEVAEGGLESALHRYVPDLRGDAGRWLPIGDRPYVLCSSGRRAAIAAGLLARRGHDPVPLLDGGIEEVLAARD